MRKLHYFNIFSVLVALMVIVAGGYGLYFPDLYFHTEPGFLRLLTNQDFVILVVYIPLLLISTWMTAQNSFRGELIWLGTMGYLCYVYFGYAFGGISNKLFLLHITIAAFTFFLFLIKLALIDTEKFRLRFEVISFSFTAFFMIAVALLIDTLWLQASVPFIPEPVFNFPFLELKTMLAIKVLDLAFLGPLCFLSGLWLYDRKAIGYVLTAILLVIIPAKFGTMITEFELKLNLMQTNCIFCILSLVALILLIRFLKKLREEKLTNYHERISSNF